jgi:hypothetical protein
MSSIVEFIGNNGSKTLLSMLVVLVGHKRKKKKVKRRRQKGDRKVDWGFRKACSNNKQARRG